MTYTTRIRRGTVAACTALVLALGAAAPALAGDTQPHVATYTQQHTQRGELIASTPLSKLTSAELTKFLEGRDMDASTVRHGVRAYRLTYRTVDPQGQPTTATGLFVLPDSKRQRLDLVSDTHGTMVHRDYAPSVGEDFGRVAPYLHASAGRAVAAPDYLGLGKGPGKHPYMDTKSAVTASVDMLRAARSAARQQGRTLTGDVYATGFSQGGQVAMALGKELERGVDRHFRLRALAPVGGPYDLEGEEVPAVFDGRVNDISAIFYVSYFLVAQNRLHGIYQDPSEVFRAPYADRVEALFDGEHQEEDIVKQLPGTVKELLTPEFYERMQHPTGVLLDVLRSNSDSCGWGPKAPVRLYAGAADTDVPIANARSCAADLADHGVRAPVLDQGPVDHFGSFKAASPKIVRWFSELQQGR
ncbi:alpha/beta hydrolase family protein [Streptomyces sp. NBC_01304]|uniref:alpha/beta hydrolase family protein n=1 Tax=Streptomyces sp. NBC_01304 TaxID=2903818 RepID=UPI002E0F52C8|nr:alpha/beta hydrolase [Streptomyces sp. NBC_01304]